MMPTVITILVTAPILALGTWLYLRRRALFAFLLGVLLTAVFVGYCAYYQGIPEMGGIIHALCGGAYGVLALKVINWLRSRPRGSAPNTGSPNPSLRRMPGSGSVSKPDISGPAPLS